MIMAAEQSCDLLSEGWRLRKADNVIQSQSKCLRTGETNVVNHSPGLALMRNISAEVVKQEIKSQFLLPLPIVYSSTQWSE